MFRKRFNQILILALSCVLLQACAISHKSTEDNSQKASDSASAEDNKSKANEAFAKGDYINAYAQYAKLLEKDPENQDLIFYYAESLRMSGLTGLALDQYNRLIAKDKNNLAAIEGRGLSFLQNGDLQNALAQLHSVVEKDSLRWRSINAIGVVYSIAGKSDEAMKYYNMALAVSGNNPSIINNIALGVAFAGDSAKGIELLKKILPSMPENDKKKIVENNLALIYGTSGKMDEAEVILRKNLPEPAVYNNLGFYAKIASDQKLAWSYLSKAISASPVFYEKAENNMRDIENSSSSVENAEIASDEEKAPSASVVTKVSSLSKAELAALQATDTSGPKLAPIKAWRGTHKLPLPSLRPQY